MSENLNRLSEAELRDMIASAEKALRAKRDSKRKEVIAQIKKLAASIGVVVEIKDEKGGVVSGMKVPPKYQDPDDPSKQWTGRGMRPAWVRKRLDEGYTLDQLEIKT